MLHLDSQYSRSYRGNKVGSRNAQPYSSSFPFDGAPIVSVSNVLLDCNGVPVVDVLFEG